MSERGDQAWTWTVGEMAQEFGVTVRTLHHYDAVGLLVPSERSMAGYRLYTSADLDRLARIVVYRRLELPLEQIRDLLERDTDAAEHLKRQREAVLARMDELASLATAIEHELERVMSGQEVTCEEMREIFGDGFSDEYQAEAKERWGESDAWKQSAARTRRYTKEDWQAIKAESDAVNAAFVAALTSGAGADSPAAMDAAEAHRRQIDERFYDCSHDFHRGLADMYLADPRFTETYENIEPGLAQFVRDAIHANADRHAG